MDKRPTLRTIAAATGLAVATVSRALGDAPDLAAATKDRVRRAAADLGYVRDRAALRLRTGRTQVIALVMSTEHDMMNHTARLISSLAGTLRGTPYHLNVTPFLPGEDPGAPIRRIVEGRLADAVIFNQTRPEDDRAAWLLERGFPFATHGRTDWADRHPWADYDNEAFGAICVRRLARAGRRRIVAVAPPAEQAYGGHFAAGVLRGAAETGAAARLLAVTSDDPGESVAAAVAEALREGADGVACASTAAAMAALRAIEAQAPLGLRADLVAKEAIPFLGLVRPGIMALREDVGRAGAVLARAAIRAATEPGAPPLQDLEVPLDADEAVDGRAA